MVLPSISSLFHFEQEVICNALNVSFFLIPHGYQEIEAACLEHRYYSDLK